MTGYETRVTPSGATVVLATGRVDFGCAADLRHQLHQIIGAGNTRLVVDLEGAHFLDSSAIGALISALKAARQAGGDLRISAPNEQIAAILDLSNVGRILVAYSDADAAFEEPA